METHSPKQQRSDSAIAEVDATTGTTLAVASNEKPIVRDETYYRETGDCVILVDTVLFKIHRLLLEREISAFSNMFSMPQENANSQATSDDDPLVLYDDVEDFRALCWIIYALPIEQSQQHTLDTANMQILVSLYLMSHKYQFEKNETFARDLLCKHCLSLKSQPSINSYFTQCPESRLQAILQISILTEESSPLLPSLLRSIWTNRLEQTEGSISYALGVAEALGLQNFMAELYYLEITRMEPVALQGVSACAHLFPDLAPHQRLVLYQGNWSLRCYWSNTRLYSPLRTHFDCTDTEANSYHMCEIVWRKAWSGVDDGERESRHFDPLKELSKVQVKMESVAKNCRSCSELESSCAVPAISGMIDSLKDNLADHFFGPLPTAMRDV